MPRSPGAILIVAGLTLSVIGALVWLGAFRWFGRLPGDLRIERPGVTVFIPLASMFVISVLLSLGAAVARAILMRK
ncbi:MAG TPA: DUF2905 domain-containing protein [Candidatus Polarisedimenticolaceae bacterium]|nr:DUF2905 domain-containing protein [Candidatus Polarisedimenticolaceae bacterium]